MRSCVAGYSNKPTYLLPKVISQYSIMEAKAEMSNVIIFFSRVSKNWTLWKTKLHSLRLSSNCWPRKQTIVSEHDPKGDFRFYLCSVQKQNLCFSVLPEPRAATWVTELSPVYYHCWGKLGWNKPCIFKTEEHQLSHKAQHRRCQSDPLASSPHLLRFFFTLQALIPNWLLVEREFGLARERRWNRQNACAESVAKHMPD